MQDGANPPKWGLKAGTKRERVRMLDCMQEKIPVHPRVRDKRKVH